MSDNKPAPPKPPPRFSWPMRLFLAAMVACIVVHNVTSLFPYRDWMQERNLRHLPRRLPTHQEIAQLRAGAVPGQPDPVAERVFESLDSVWDYFKPWPPADARPKIQSWRDRALWAYCWFNSRMLFLEHLAGFEQNWGMFSPNAVRGATVVRIRLLYTDGSVKEVRLAGDPPDLTKYAHWFEKETLAYELKIDVDEDTRLGYCNYLAHREATSTAGKPLSHIYFYLVRYHYPAPQEDAAAVLRAQNGPPDWDKDGPFWVYDVAARKGRSLSDAERQQAQEALARAAE